VAQNDLKCHLTFSDVFATETSSIYNHNLVMHMFYDAYLLVNNSAFLFNIHRFQ